MSNKPKPMVLRQQCRGVTSRGYTSMSQIYEKPTWTEDAKRYDTTSAFFATLAYIFGAIGFLTAIVVFFVGLAAIADGGFAGIIGSILMGMQSVMLMVFGSMLRSQSRVLLAVFEMSLGETRYKINQTEADQDLEC